MNFVSGKCWQTFCLLKKQKMAEILVEHQKKKQLYLSTFAPTLRHHLSGFSLPSKTLSPAKDYQFHFKLL